MWERERECSAAQPRTQQHRTPQTPKLANMLPHVAEGTLQMWLSVLRGEDCPRWSGWVQWSHRVFIRGRQEYRRERRCDDGRRRERERERGLKMLRCWLWRWGKSPRATERRRPLEPGQRPAPPEGTQPRQHPDSRTSDAQDAKTIDSCWFLHFQREFKDEKLGLEERVGPKIPSHIMDERAIWYHLSRRLFCKMCQTVTLA